MSELVLITGGAGFIGSHLTDELLTNGYKVRVLDNLTPQVHGSSQMVPAYFNREAEFIFGDIRDKEIVSKCLQGVSIVFHLAAAVGVGQSMYQIQKYTSINNSGTATLLEAIIEHDIKKLIIASSMSIYGEGAYKICGSDQYVFVERTIEQLKNGKWDPEHYNSLPIEPVATSENKTPSLASVYALSKFDQEQMCLMIGRTYNIETIALRFFNVFGTRQALSNPYTGVLAIFASRFLNNKQPVIFEDGNQLRDFVSVTDVIKACRQTLEHDGLHDKVFNIGSGKKYSINEIAQKIGYSLNRKNIEPIKSGKYRAGDIRHCFADISKAKKYLNYSPVISIDEGIKELVPWLETQIAVDNVEHATSELIERGLSL